MATLYKPVLIESAEQAEALPVGTVVIRTRVGVIEKGRRGWWSGLNQVPDQTPIGASALVPIDAEEEMDTDYYTGGDGSPVRRLVTPWGYA